MIRTIWGDPGRYRTSYYPDDFQGRYYLAGDGAIRDEKSGYFTITGRIDDVLNVSGHRMGTMEIESALVANPLVAEAAVVGRPDETSGEAVCAFVVLKGPRPTGDEAGPAKQLRDWVARRSVRRKPKDIRFGDNLPKTARARSCDGCCARPRKNISSRRTPARSRTLPSWNSSARRTERLRVERSANPACAVAHRRLRSSA